MGVSAGERLYCPTGGGFRPSLKLRMLHMLLHLILCYLWISLWVVALLPRPSGAPFGAPVSLLTFCIPVAALGRAATRAALTFLRDATAGLRLESATQYTRLEGSVATAVDRFSASFCKADVWQDWLLNTEEFFGPADGRFLAIKLRSNTGWMPCTY